ncbi:178_t:CDS:2, partial [Entrophospora sp. SA101]
HESNDLPSDWREILDNSDDSDIEWETQEVKEEQLPFEVQKFCGATIIGREWNH